MRALNITGLVLMVLFAISIGLYPLMYYLSDTITQHGLLSQKPLEVTSQQLWFLQFHAHIIFGGLALLTGWSQFLKKLRNKNLGLHRLLGKIYLISIAISGQAGLCIAFYAEGGLVAKLGFGSLAILWLLTSFMAYTAIRKGQIIAHQKWMIRSYALTFAAVTLRIWLPLFQYGIGMDFTVAYVIIAWLCWVPNLVWAEWKVRYGLT